MLIYISVLLCKKEIIYNRLTTLVAFTQVFDLGKDKANRLFTSDSIFRIQLLPFAGNQGILERSNKCSSCFIAQATSKIIDEFLDLFTGGSD